jgi:hypothetical protein
MAPVRKVASAVELPALVGEKVSLVGRAGGTKANWYITFDDQRIELNQHIDPSLIGQMVRVEGYLHRTMRSSSKSQNNDPRQNVQTARRSVHAPEFIVREFSIEPIAK